MITAIGGISPAQFTSDHHSIYRALNRFEGMALVESEMRQAEVGPQRRSSSLTHAGQTLLAKFIQRNIFVFEEPEIAERIRAACGKTGLPA